MTWAAVAWIAVWLTTYLYAVNDLITWPSSLKGLEILSSQVTRGRCIRRALNTFGIATTANRRVPGKMRAREEQELAPLER